MSIVPVGNYSSYNVNIACGTYPSPFLIHFFIGEVPKYITFQDTSVYDLPSWVGVGVVYPRPVATMSAGAAAQTSAAGYSTRDVSDESSTFTSLEPRAGEDDIAPPLPESYFAGGTRHSSPLTPGLRKRYNVTYLDPLQAETIREDLQRNFKWLLVDQDGRQILVTTVPIRMWVIKQLVQPAPDVTSFPISGTPEVVWDATRGKLGGLHRGEIPSIG